MTSRQLLLAWIAAETADYGEVQQWMFSKEANVLEDQSFGLTPVEAWLLESGRQATRDTIAEGRRARNAEARQQLARCLEHGEPFGIYLRGFRSEAELIQGSRLRLQGPASPTSLGVLQHLRPQTETAAIAVARDLLPLVAIDNPRRLMATNDGCPGIAVSDAEWLPIVQLLIAEATLIVIAYLPDSRGLEDELEAIGQAQRQPASVVLVDDAGRTPAPGDPPATPPTALKERGFTSVFPASALAEGPPDLAAARDRVRTLLDEAARRRPPPEPLSTPDLVAALKEGREPETSGWLGFFARAATARWEQGDTQSAFGLSLRGLEFRGLHPSSPWSIPAGRLALIVLKTFLENPQAQDDPSPRRRWAQSILVALENHLADLQDSEALTLRGQVRASLAHLWIDEGDRAQALAYLQAARSDAEASGNRRLAFHIWRQQAITTLNAGQTEEGWRLHNAFLEATARDPDPEVRRMHVDLRLRLARSLSLAGAIREAAQAAGQAIAAAEAAGDTDGAARGFDTLADLNLLLGNPTEALLAARRAGDTRANGSLRSRLEGAPRFILFTFVAGTPADADAVARHLFAEAAEHAPATAIALLPAWMQIGGPRRATAEDRRAVEALWTLAIPLRLPFPPWIYARFLVESGQPADAVLRLELGMASLHGRHDFKERLARVLAQGGDPAPLLTERADDLEDARLHDSARNPLTPDLVLAASAAQLTGRPERAIDLARRAADLARAALPEDHPIRNRLETWSRSLAEDSAPGQGPPAATVPPLAPPITPPPAASAATPASAPAASHAPPPPATDPPLPGMDQRVVVVVEPILAFGMIERANQAFRQGRPAEAEVHLRTAEGLLKFADTDRSRPNWSRGDLQAMVDAGLSTPLMLKGRSPEAAERVARALRHFREFPDLPAVVADKTAVYREMHFRAQFAEGSLLTQQGAYPEAVRALDQALRLGAGVADDTDLRHGRAMLHQARALSATSPDERRAARRDALRACPEESGFVSAYLQEVLDDHGLDSARAEARQLARDFPDSTAVALVGGALHLEVEPSDPAGALALFHHALRLAPGSPEPAGRWVQALAATSPTGFLDQLESAASDHATSPWLALYAAQAIARSGAPGKDALSWLEAALQRRPDLESVVDAAWSMLRQLEEENAARTRLVRAFEATGSTSAAMAARIGVSFLDAAPPQPGPALEWLERAVAAPHSPAIQTAWLRALRAARGIAGLRQTLELRIARERLPGALHAALAQSLFLDAPPDFARARDLLLLLKEVAPAPAAASLTAQIAWCDLELNRWSDPEPLLAAAQSALAMDNLHGALDLLLALAGQGHAQVADELRREVQAAEGTALPEFWLVALALNCGTDGTTDATDPASVAEALARFRETLAALDPPEPRPLSPVVRRWLARCAPASVRAALHPALREAGLLDRPDTPPSSPA